MHPHTLTPCRCVLLQTDGSENGDAVGEAAAPGLEGGDSEA